MNFRGTYLASLHEIYMFIFRLCKMNNKEEALDFLDSYAEFILDNNKEMSIEESYEVAKRNIGYLAIEYNIEEKDYRWLEENVGIYHPYFQDPFIITPEQAFKLGYNEASKFKGNN